MKELKDNMGWIEPLARAGYASRGVVYLIIGVLVLLGAAHSAGSSPTRDAIKTLLEQPFGTAMAWALVVGLAGYVAWRLVQSGFDTDKHGTSLKGLGIRAGLLGSAITYTMLALYTLSLLGVFGAGSGDGGDSFADRFAAVIGSGSVLAIISLVFAVVAFAHLWKAFRRKYEDHMQATSREMGLIHPVSIAGLAARGMVFAIISLLGFLRLRSGSGGGDIKPGLGDALAFIAGLPFGALLLTLTGAGLIAFSLYSFIEARWRRINWEDA